jgi:hypothetical protein
MTYERPQAPAKTPAMRREMPQRPQYKSHRRFAAAALAGSVLIAVAASVVILGAGSARPSATRDRARPSSTPARRSTGTSPSPPQPPALTAVSTYWEAIARHDFAAAYAILAPGAVPQTEAQWASREQETGVQSVRFAGRVVTATATVARVLVLSLITRDRQYGCRRWTGTYRMSNRDGHWLIVQADLTPAPCTLG